MKAIALVPGTSRLSLVERDEPQAGDGEVRLQVLDVGICGTDREEVQGGRGQAPPGSNELVLGHEVLARVVDANSSNWRRGDFAVVSVRRPCGHCLPCSQGRSDMCVSGDYRERGIKEADGFQQEFIVDREEFLVPVPAAIAGIGVLTEPMSIAQKGIDEAIKAQSSRLSFRQPAYSLAGQSVLVAGLGAVGLLTAVTLALRGASVHGLDIVPGDNPRVQILETLGGAYVNGRHSEQGKEHGGHFAAIFEATGIAQVEFDLLDCLAPNGVYVAMGLPGGDRLMQLDGAGIFRSLVLGNQVLVGTVNASLQHVHAAVADLAAAQQRWPGALERLITRRRPVSEYQQAFFEHPPDEIKTVVRWAAP